MNFSDVAGIDEAKEELSEIVDFLKTPEKYQQARRPDPARACCCRASPAPARRCWPRRWPARPACRSSRSRPPSSSRRSWASAPRACATSSSRPRTPRRRSSSSTSSTPSAARARAAAGSPAAATTSASRRSTRSSPRWTASRPATAWWCWRPPTGRRSSTRRCCAPGASTAAWRCSRRTRSAAQKILEVHTRSVPLADDVDLEALAQATPGMVGADLANVVNEAALLAARRGHDRVRAGATSRTRSRRSCSAPSARWCSPRRTAAGSPTTRAGTRSSACSPPGADPVRKVSIIPRGQALGVTLSAPGRRRVQLLGGLPARQDQGRAGRPGGRGGRVRHDHHRRRVRHPAGHR